MINSSSIFTNELFDWVGDFIRVTGVPISAALQTYAECCYFQDHNALLKQLISIEDEYNTLVEDNDTSDGDDPDFDSEIYCEHYANHQLTLDSLAEEDAKKFAAHYESVLTHHGFNKQFCVYFIQHFHPLSEYVTSIAPAIDKKFIFKHQYSFDPFFTEPPEAPQYNWLNVFERMDREPAIDPRAWIAVFKMLGFCGLDSDLQPSWPAYEASFYLGATVEEAKRYCDEEGIEYDEDDDYFDLHEGTSVFLSPIRISHPDALSFDMIELRIEIEREESSAIILYSAPCILRSPDKRNFISVWGEIYDGEAWKLMPLHSKSTSLKKINQDAFVHGDEPIWSNVASPDLPLVENWQKHRGSSENPQSATNSEVVDFKPNHG